jgi:tRNA nucleotidyltransferase (CCA-adding enzyme)
MEIYIVGGAVRDLRQKRPPKDTDRVVVGSSPAEMIAQGFVQVGADFPVFLHPDTHEEYALARTERKSGKGYAGFETSTEAVTLDEDLSRRDLTINAMAMHEVTEELFDPFGGDADLQAKVLRHVSPAFADDPVRVLRVARFMARFGPEWSIAPSTMALMHEMVRAGTLDELVGERVWVEIQKGLGEDYPEEMLKVMSTLNLFDRPCFKEYAGAKQANIEVLQKAVHEKASLTTLFALAFPRQWDISELKNSRIPKEIRDVNHTLQHGLSCGLGRFGSLTAAEKVDVLTRMDAFRQTERLRKVFEVMLFSHREEVSPVTFACSAALGIDTAKAIAGAADGKEIQKRILEARIEAVTLYG